MLQPPHSFAERFVRGNILSRWWALVSIGLSALSAYFVLAGLSVHQYGLYQLVLAAAAFGSVVSVNIFDAIVGNDISQSLSQGRPGHAKRLYLEFAVLKVGGGCLVALALFFGAAFLAGRLSPDIASYVRLISVLFALRAVRSVMSIFLASVVSLRGLGEGAVEELARALIIGWYFFAGQLSIWPVLAAGVAGAGAAALYLAIPFYRDSRRFFRETASSRHFLFPQIVRSYGFWLLLRTALAKVVDPIRPWLVRAFLNTEAVAFYRLAETFVTLIKKNLFPRLGTSLLSWEVERPARLRYIFTRSVKYSLWYGMLLAVLSVAAVPVVISALFPKYLPALPLFLIFAAAIPFHGVMKIEYNLLTVLREQRALAARLLTEVALNTGANIILLPLVGLPAIGITVSSAIVWRTWFYYRKLVQACPFLRVRRRDLLGFDAEDGAIFRRGMSEVKVFWKSRRFGSAAARR